MMARAKLLSCPQVSVNKGIKELSQVLMNQPNADIQYSEIRSCLSETHGLKWVILINQGSHMIHWKTANLILVTGHYQQANFLALQIIYLA